MTPFPRGMLRKALGWTPRRPPAPGPRQASPSTDGPCAFFAGIFPLPFQGFFPSFKAVKRGSQRDSPGGGGDGSGSKLFPPPETESPGGVVTKGLGLDSQVRDSSLPTDASTVVRPRRPRGTSIGVVAHRSQPVAAAVGARAPQRHFTQ